MRNCSQCKTDLPDGAYFCPECGTKQAVTQISCTHCGGIIPDDADFCIYCGIPTELISAEDEPIATDFVPTEYEYQAKYPLDFRETVRLPLQLRTYFLKALRERLIAEGNGQYFDDYVDRFYETSFLQTFDEAAKEMVEHCYLLHKGHFTLAQRQVDAYLTEKFQSLMNTFIISEGSKIHTPPITDKVLQYDETSVSDQRMGDMVLDYLDMEEEQEQWYADMTEMPSHKLQNAYDRFLFVEHSESIFLICDQTIFGSCNEGFALTNKALYWKAHFNKAQRMNYNEIDTIELTEEWLVLNGKFFNANPAINVKMMHLLKKLQEKS